MRPAYRHLREHGNALLIILMEVILAAALYAADTLIRFFTLAVYSATVRLLALRPQIHV